MKEKHLRARIKQCLAIAECSPCTRRTFGAVLFDPVRNADLTSGYNGTPRGAKGDLCGGDFCLRDGLREEDVVVADYMGAPIPDDVTSTDDNDVCLFVKGKRVAFDVTSPRGETFKLFASWLDDARAARRRLLETYPPIPSGKELQIGCHHAEMNVITHAAAMGVRTEGAWLVITGEPCLMCSKLIHHAGIKKVICVRGGYQGGDAGPVYLREHDVEVEYVDGPQDPRIRWR